MTKKALILFTLLLAPAVLTSSVRSEDATSGGKNQIREKRGEIIKEKRENIRELNEKVREEKRELVGNLKNKAGRYLPKSGKAHLVDSQVTSVSGSVINALAEGKSYIINTDSSTKFRRHFWGNSSIADISAGDKINVWGDWADTGKTTINAKVVKNLSVQKRFGVFIGTVNEKTGNGFTLQSVNRGAQKVTVNNGTKYVNRKMQTIGFADINTGDKVRAKGLWDNALNQITEVTHIKDYSLPKAPPSETASPSANEPG